MQLYITEPNLPLFNVCPDLIDPEKDTKTRNDPLLYWRENASRKPMLASLARKYLSAPSGSVALERLFSTAADIADEKRNRLATEKVEMLLFLKKNLQLLNFDSINYPCCKYFFVNICNPTLHLIELIHCL